MDAGFYSSHNISELLLNNLKFITRVDIRSCRWIKKLALENFSRFNPYSATCPFDIGTSGFTLMVKHQFNTTCKYNTDKHKAGEKVSFERRLYLHFFLNRAIELDKHTNASAKILELERVIREGKFSELSYSAKRLATKLFKIRRSKDGLKITVKDESFEEMKKLCFSADIILPNITEACFLTGTEYKTDYDRDYAEELMKNLAKDGAKKIVLTGVRFSDKTIGVGIYEDGQSRYYEHRLISKGCHGTGDIYSSAFAGALLKGKSLFDAAKIAADYTVECIENTQGDPAHWYGAKFEPVLPMLIKALE